MLRHIVDSLPVLISYIDTDLQYRFANKAYEKWFGIPIEEMIGKTMGEMLGEETVQHFQPYIDRALEGEKFQYEAWAPYKWGGPRYIQVDYIPDMASDGSVAGFCVLVVDLTDSKAAEQAIQESEERFRSMAESVSSPIWVSDTTPKNIYVNKSWLDYTGLSYEEALNPKWEDLIHPDDLESYLATCFAAMERREPFQAEVRLKQPNGEYGWLLSSGSPRYLPDGQYVGYIGIGKDITQRKQMEEALKSSEARYSLIIAGTNDGIWDWDLIGDEYYWNDRFYEILGLTREDLPNPHGEIGWKLIHPEDLVKVQNAVKDHLAERKPYLLELRMRHVTGEYRYLRATAQAIWDETGKAIRIAGAVTDITDSKKAEEALKKSEERYRLVAAGTNDGIWDWDIKADQSYWSDRFYEIIGYKRDELGRSSYELLQSLIHPEDKARVEQGLRQAVDKGLPTDYEYRLRHKKGHYITLHSKGKPVLNEHGNVIRMAGVVTDVSERKQAEQALREIENRYRTVFYSNLIGIVISNIDTKQIIEANDTFLSMTGFSQDDLKQGKINWQEITPPEYRHLNAKALKGIRETGHTGTLEKQYFRKDGSRIDVFIGGTLLEGTDNISITFVHDISDRKQAEEDLKKSEERYRSIFETVYDGIWEWDMKTSKVFWNDRLYEMHGLDKTTYFPTLENFLELVHPDDQDKIQKVMQAHLEDGHPYLVEIRQRHSSGEYRTFFARGAALRDSAGIPYRMVGATIDITERKRIEEALAESEKRYSLVIDSSNDGLYDLDLVNNKAYWSDRYFELLGYEPQEFEISFEKFAELLHPEEREYVISAIHSYMQRPGNYETEYRMLHKDGHYLTVICRGGTMFEQGRAIRLLGLVRDITDRKNSELEKQETLEKERLLRNVMEIVNQSFELDHALDEIVKAVGQFFKADRCGLLRYDVVDGELIVKLSRQYSPNFQPLDEIPFKSLGLLKQTLLKHQEPDVINISCLEEIARESKEYFEKYTLDAELYYSEMENLFSKFSIKSNLAVEIYYQGRPYGMIGLHQCTHTRAWTNADIALLRDIAAHVGVAFSQAELYWQEQRARAELESYAKKLELSNRELEQFAVVASHDLQEPLRKVMIFSQYLHRASGNVLTDESKDYIARMQNATERMQALITDLLDLSRVNRKGQAFQKTDLNHVISDVVSDLHFAILDSNGKVEFQNLPMLEADEKQMHQLFQNLIGNALKFHQKDVPAIVTISAQKIGHNICEIQVKDNGIGFEEKYKDKIFGIFEQLHSRSEYGGTGVGLAICQKIVERHGGTITATSSPDKGATFFITLPIKH